MTKAERYVYAACAVSQNKEGQIQWAARISFVSEAEALGLAIMAVEGGGYECIGSHIWWETIPARSDESAVPQGCAPNTPGDKQ